MMPEQGPYGRTVHFDRVLSAEELLDLWTAKPQRWETLRALAWLVRTGASAVWDMLCSDLARLRRTYREDRRRKGEHRG